MSIYTLWTDNDPKGLAVTLADLVNSEIKLDSSDLFQIAGLEPGEKLPLPEHGITVQRTQ